MSNSAELHVLSIISLALKQSYFSRSGPGTSRSFNTLLSQTLSTINTPRLSFSNVQTKDLRGFRAEVWPSVSHHEAAELHRPSGGKINSPAGSELLSRRNPVPFSLSQTWSRTLLRDSESNKSRPNISQAWLRWWFLQMWASGWCYQRYEGD